MKILSSNLSEISAHKYLRCDYKYWNKTRKVNFTQYLLLKDVFTIIKGTVQTEHYSLDKTAVPYIRISDIELKFGIDLSDTVYLDEDAAIPEEKILKKDDLILAVIGSVGKMALAEYVQGGTHSNNTVVLRAKNSDINMKFYEKLFQSNYYNSYLLGVVSQKAQPNLQLYDLKNIKLPIIDNSLILSTVARISPIEKQISDLKANIKDIQGIVDEVLQNEFHFDYAKFYQLKEIKNFSYSLSAFSLNPDLRFSAKFHRPAGDFVMQELLKVTSKKFKHFLSEPIVLGASVSPSDYDDNGDCYYLSMATIKNWAFEKESAQTVSNAYFEANREKNIKQWDILLARAGEGTIGKVALIESEDMQAVFADFTMRIRLKDYNPKFAYYYMRSAYFQYLVEIYKKGLGNNTNIFPIVVREFPLIDIPIVEQQRIVDEIQAEIDKQNEIKNHIATLRMEIDKIVESAACLSEN